MVISWQEVIEGHYLETVDGLFFAVKGLVHPPDRTLACLRYAPDPAGERVLGARRYRRLYHFPEQESLLRDGYPGYLAFDPACGLTLQSVPHACVQRVLDPRARLQVLREGRAAGWTGAKADSGRAALAADVLAFAALLESEAGVPPAALGVSGSLLIGLDTAASDLDMQVYGRSHGRAVQRALHRLLDGDGHPELRRLDAAGLAELYRVRSADTRMAFADFAALEGRKINQGTFRGRPYFLRFVPAPGEIGERYGDLRFHARGRATIEATVADAGENLFTPCRYGLAEVRRVAGLAVEDLREIVSFRGRFCEQAGAGDRVLAAGAVELVVEGGERWQRLLLGNAVDDTLTVRGSVPLSGKGVSECD